MRTETKPEPAPCVPAAAPAGVAFLLAWVLALDGAIAQTPGPPAPAPAGTPSQSQPATPPQDTVTFGTFVEQGGQLMQQGVTTMGAGFGQMVGAIGGQANQATKDAAEAARQAAESVTKLPTTGITAGHERCVIAPNGAPDCRAAAETLCRAKGFAGGTSVDSVTVENCPPQYRAARRNAPAGACTMENYVTKAVCQ
jgi:hypothetical protein